jgi:hypothetical protein
MDRSARDVTGIHAPVGDDPRRRRGPLARLRLAPVFALAGPAEGAAARAALAEPPARMPVWDPPGPRLPDDTTGPPPSLRRRTTPPEHP